MARATKISHEEDSKATITPTQEVIIIVIVVTIIAAAVELSQGVLPTITEIIEVQIMQVQIEMVMMYQPVYVSIVMDMAIGDVIVQNRQDDYLIINNKFQYPETEMYKETTKVENPMDLEIIFHNLLTMLLVHLPLPHTSLD
jgi:hypothetical protein